MTVNTDKKSYSSYISFDVLYENDFNNASSLSEYNTWGSGEVKDSGIRGGHPVYGPVLKNTDANKKWQDYTVEWVINGTDNVGVSTFRTVLYSNNASHTNYGESYGGFGLCVELGASSGVTVTSASNEKITQDITDSYPQSENGSKNFDYNYFAGTDKKWTTSVSILGDKVFGAVYDKDGNAVHKLTSTLKTTPKNTAGAFGFNANSKPESTDGVNNFHYTDYVVAYKLVASDLEYSSSIANGAKNLYDVNELELKWNYDIASVDNSNIEITEVSKNGESTYTDFSVSHEDNKTVITFNTALNGESKYNIAFKNIDGLNPMPISFTMGGVFERINASGNNVLKVKESGQISVNGTTDTGTVFDIDLENVELASSDESVISVNSSGKIEALDRGYATIDIRYTDTNTTNPNLDSNGQLGTQINVYSYMSSSEAKADSDFDFRDGLLRGEFKESISVKFDNGFVYEKASDGDAHTLEILKDSDGFRVFLDGSEVKTGSADGCKKITEITGFEKAEAYNLIGNVCYAEYLNVRGTKTLTAEYSYKDSDGDKESGSAIEWYYSGSSDGAYTKIANADGKTLNASGYNGKYVKFAVTPSNKYEKGERVESAPVKVNISGGSSNGSSSSSSAKKNNTSVSITATGGVTEPTVETTGIFKDVAGTHWAYASIKAMKEKGVVNGFSDGTFKPDSPVTRAEFVCALSKLLGLGEASYSGTFSDVSESDWFAGYVQAAYNSGYVKGEGELFRPNDTITRQEMAVIIARVINSSERAELNFTDSSDISDWAIDSVKSVLAKGIMTGNADGSFSPHASTTRAQMAAIMERISK